MDSLETITIQDIKKRGSKVIADDAPSYLIVNSKVKSVMVPPEEFKMLIEALEELEDIAAIDERKNDETIDAKEVYKKLGI